ncbi:methyltransferase, TIGR04325 family [Sulfitobacter sabulilitoris]|uniref:Methyltransferase, TIGR04325 family n=1 Tax=Sulfitobacter sabulilitoris TaxID=2562655 RepID=A0A5S3PBI6_9RHOB|nr:methyltransferase, TIGR04325 family [Sulfitobacter sabulilitoris]TMM51052.1 methyltransferase, TIGR04325 family [Sulfitobacter sabulilitoris]
MRPRQMAKSALTVARRTVGLPAATFWGRLMASGIRPPAFVGAYPDFDTARANAPKTAPNTYDDDTVAPLNFKVMCEVHIWDYPVIFWLERLLKPDMHVLDAGGHFGTKYIAFQHILALGAIRWTVQDLPATIRGARAGQRRGDVPGEIRFLDDVTQAESADILLMSGLLQYLDRPIAELVSALPARPPHIVLNKVATRDGPTVVTLEKIGTARVPYQIRNREAFEADLRAMGYVIRDSWTIPSLARVIATHPALGASTSRGYYLERAA